MKKAARTERRRMLHSLRNRKAWHRAHGEEEVDASSSQATEAEQDCSRTAKGAINLRPIRSAATRFCAD